MGLGSTEKRTSGPPRPVVQEEGQGGDAVGTGVSQTLDEDSFIHTCRACFLL